MSGTTKMFEEASEAGAAVARLMSANGPVLSRIGTRLKAKPPRLAITCARGSSDHAATYAKYLIETIAGVMTASAAPSISSVYGAPARLDGALCLAISQSGKSPDLLSTVESARAGGAFVVALVNDAYSPLAALAHEVVALQAGPERSVAATKSYVASLAGIAALVAEWAEDAGLRAALDSAPASLDRAWTLDWSPMVGALKGATSLYTIGRGLGLGIAQEAALKLKETCALHAEAFSAAELRHGPMALVKPGFPVLVFRQRDETLAGTDELVADLEQRGARLLAAGLTLPSIEAHPAIEPLLQIQSFYGAANALSLARGLNPDRPPHLAKVTETL